MAIIDRVKERIESDLSDTEIQLIIDEANQDIINQFGPHWDPANPITVRVDGDRRNIILMRAIDIAQPLVVTEFITSWGWGETQVVLGDDDYRIWDPGFRVERLTTGSQPPYFHKWAEQVTFEYVPLSDNNKREEVMIKLSVLAIEYDGLARKDVGDVKLFSNEYQGERDKLMNSLAPRGGFYIA
jgi:hypothetical protein